MSFNYALTCRSLSSPVFLVEKAFPKQRQKGTDFRVEQRMVTCRFQEKMVTQDLGAGYYFPNHMCKDVMLTAAACSSTAMLMEASVDCVLLTATANLCAGQRSGLPAVLGNLKLYLERSSWI